MKIIILSILSLLSFFALNVSQADISGNITYEYTYFPQDALYEDQENDNSSFSGEITYYKQITAGTSFNIKPFYRFDEVDKNRNHGDLREAYFLTAFADFELSYGINKVYWGATEFNNVVDIINQDDFVEGFGTDEKLGQPMVQFNYLYDIGGIEFFVLPYHRAREFADIDGGRPQFALPIETDEPYYEDDKKEQHIDYAIATTNTFGDFDVRLSGFVGTDRSPVFLPINFHPVLGKPTILQPAYYQMQQIGLDITAAIDSWLLKLEMIDKKIDEIDADYNAGTAGFEYTLVGLFGRSDLGILMERAYDSRKKNIPTTLFQNDVMAGLRLSLNDASSTTFLLGYVHDLDDGADIMSLEFERRIADSFKIKFEAQHFKNAENDINLNQFRRDESYRLLLGYYF
ncbi:MAG: hypothetical protein DRQ51_05185 [Gammaproteobacteria bacterium]|nr:MAG: hypothetical protein DRQ51_05185 [Gammaproteobacteria bacterium]